MIVLKKDLVKLDLKIKIEKLALIFNFFKAYDLEVIYEELVHVKGQ